MSGPHALLWSGGKDGALALQRARAAGVDVRLLLTYGDAATGRIRFHATPREVLERQVAATVVGRGRSVFSTWEAMGERLDEQLAGLAGEGYTGIVMGNIHLADVREWYESRVRAAGLRHVEPIWGEEPAGLLGEFVASGGRAVVTCVDTDRLPISWLGRIIDQQFIADIAALDVDACGENGEYHSFAFAGPAFAGEAGWTPGAHRFDGRFAQLDIG